MILVWLRNKVKIYNGWKGFFGRLDMEGSFVIFIIDFWLMGMVGMCFYFE